MKFHLPPFLSFLVRVKKSFDQIQIGQIVYFSFILLCSGVYKCTPVYSSPILIAQIAQTQKSLKNTDSLTDPSFLKNSESIFHEYKFLQMVKDSSGRIVTNKNHKPYFVWTKTPEKPVVHLSQQFDKNYFPLVDKNYFPQQFDKNYFPLVYFPLPLDKNSFQHLYKKYSKEVAYNTCITASYYVTWKLIKYWHQKYIQKYYGWPNWPVVPQTFQKKIQDRLSSASEIPRGHYTYKEYFTNNLMNFVYLPLSEGTPKYKICKILEKPNFFLDQLSFFCDYPRIWIERIHDRSEAVSEEFREEFRDDFIRLSRECSDLSSIYKNSDSIFYYERPLFDITSNFEGNPDFFDYIFGKIVLKFWQITWKKSLSSNDY